MTSTTSQVLPSELLYPVASKTALDLQFVGKRIQDVQAPAAIVDAAVVRRNCNLMLHAAKKLGVGFRAHVKTHKTTEITKLQVGEDSEAVKLVCSTVAEIERLLPWLLEFKTQGKAINVLYGVPIVPSQVPRLGQLVRMLGQGTVGLFVDHPSHIKALDKVDEFRWPGRVPVWVNVDVGYHREGVAPDSVQLADIGDALKASKRTHLVGLYTHLGCSYNSNSPEEALHYMASELRGLEQGAESFLEHFGPNKKGENSHEKIVLSLGATPTATATQNLLGSSEAAQQYLDLFREIKQKFTLELHAGVYPFLDMQQMATRARPQNGTCSLAYSDIGFRILAEVASLYPDRGEKPEALIAAGSLVLGREPCKSYDGWGVVTPWPSNEGHHYDPEGSRSGWIVGRISQEHGILTWEGPRENFRELELGQKLLIYPNHACIAGVNFSCYLVVDSETDEPDEIRDVWIRSRGW